METWYRLENSLQAGFEAQAVSRDHQIRQWYKKEKKKKSMIKSMKNTFTEEKDHSEPGLL